MSSQATRHHPDYAVIAFVGNSPGQLFTQLPACQSPCQEVEGFFDIFVWPPDQILCHLWILAVFLKESWSIRELRTAQHQAFSDQSLWSLEHKVCRSL
jgi:hypothetical protein